MINVQIENFQSIRRLGFSIDGFTAFVGKSNIGKSSLVRAIRCALTGASGSDFVRHDPKTCGRILRGVKKCKCSSKVKFDFGGGRVLLWEKGDSVNKYTTWEDGVEKVYSQVGQNPDLPEMVASPFSPVKLGDKKELIQVSSQFNPLFLLNLNGTAVAEVLSDVAKLDEIHISMKAVVKDRKDANSTRKVREEDIQGLKKELEIYETLDSTVSRVEDVQTTFGTLQKLSSSITQLETYRQTLLTVGGDLKVLVKATKPCLPDREALGGKTVKFQELSVFYLDWLSKAQIYKQLSGVGRLSVPDAAKLKDLTERHKQLIQWAGRYHSLSGTLNTYKGLSSLELVSKPSEFQLLQDSLGKLISYKARWDTLTTSVENTASKLEDAAEEEAAVRAEFNDLGVCPFCSQAVNPEHVLCGGN